MNEEYILSNIRRIIYLEHLDIEKNAEEIERISLDMMLGIKSCGLEIEGDLYQFLDDFDIRSKNHAYLDYQTNKVMHLMSWKK